ncbi:uncharacterized protein LY89DRAFT_666733 [Mollisia scopiformis]|uniref:Uncharacterized protein n=1 Tax=Mollisia scopiformis TaxID=149040 RepID=A0A194XI39_MOLSC|nr:uncharacterized protein LY89DRAFT_666733 [Mollisia scopiformis]KUJ19890.1 hypothetical protein LY89DRAFT_666733 [Mollisia scopiformis]
MYSFHALQAAQRIVATSQASLAEAHASLLQVAVAQATIPAGADEFTRRQAAINVSAARLAVDTAQLAVDRAQSGVQVAVEAIGVAIQDAEPAPAPAEDEVIAGVEQVVPRRPSDYSYHDFQDLRPLIPRIWKAAGGIGTFDESDGNNVLHELFRSGWVIRRRDPGDSEGTFEDPPLGEPLEAYLKKNHW